MRIRCGKCGHAKIIFTVRGDRFGHHHGAICAYCRKPITLKDCLFPKVAAAKEADAFPVLPEEAEKLTSLSGMPKPVGKR